MKTIVGLFLNREDAEQATRYLCSTRLVNRQQIQILTSGASVNELLGGHQSHVLISHIGWGLFASLVLFGLYNFINLACNCSLMVFNVWFELEVLFLLAGAGVLIAGVVTYFLQVNRLNDSFRPYIYNVEQGSLVVAVETPSELQQTVIDILYHHHGSAIKTLETRFSNYWRNKSRPMGYQP